MIPLIVSIWVCSMNAVGVKLARRRVSREGFEKSKRLVGHDTMEDRKLARWLSVKVLWLACNVRLRSQCLKIRFEIGDRQHLNAASFYGWIMDYLILALPRFKRS